MEEGVWKGMERGKRGRREGWMCLLPEPFRSSQFPPAEDWKKRLYILTWFTRSVHELMWIWGQESGPKLECLSSALCDFIVLMSLSFTGFMGLNQTINNRMWFLFVVAFQHWLWNVRVTHSLVLVYPNYCCRCTSEHNQLIKFCCSSV